MFYALVSFGYSIMLSCSVVSMKLVLKVLVFLFDLLTKLSAVIEFRFDVYRKKFIRSTFLHWYSWIMYLVFVLPASCFGLYELVIGVVSSKQSSKYFTVLFNWASSWAMGSTIMGISSLVMKSKRRLLQKVLNQFLSLDQLHRQLFGKEVKIYISDSAVHIVRDLNATWWIDSDNPWLNLYLIFSWLHHMMQIMLTDATLLFNIYYLESLALCLDERLECSPAKRSLYLQYYKKLLDLSKNLQMLWWPIHISTLTFEIIFYIQLGLNKFVDNMYGAVIGILFSGLFDSNVIYIYDMTSEIHRLEKKILNDLIELEILLSDKETHTMHNLRIVQVSNRFNN